MEVKAITYKNWCTENISPQSWTRITLKSLDAIRAAGYNLKDLENPNDSIVLSGDLLNAYNKVLNELYEVSVEQGIFS